MSMKESVMPHANVSSVSRPVIGITVDLVQGKYTVGRSYARMVSQAGGAPVMLSCETACIPDYLHLCDGIILSGGDDPDTTRWGVPVHPKAKPLHPDRQAFEVALLAALDDERRKPALGICLGMQLMGLHCGGELDQHLPDSLASAADHWDGRAHTITGDLGEGDVNSHHRQALSDPVSMRVIARSADGVIEAVRRDDHPFYLGVQWHPERTEDQQLGIGVIRQLVDACKSAGA
jgi:putative glutamine amidotransferase